MVADQVIAVTPLYLLRSCQPSGAVGYGVIQVRTSAKVVVHEKTTG